MSEAMRAPKSAATLEVATATSTERVFVCAERELKALAAQDEVWIGEITRRDLASATLESGNYDDENISGFRIHLHHRVGEGKVELELKGAGAYFIDLGVEAATRTFKQRLQQCLAENR